MAKEQQDIQYSQIHIEQDDNIIWMSFGKHKLFLAHGKTGLDAELLYLHLIFTAGLQKTNSVLAKDKYLQAGLKMSRPRLKRAKGLLHSLKLISYKSVRSIDGTWKDWYVTVHCSSVLPKQEHPVGTFTVPLVNQPTGFRQQMLKPKKKSFNKQGNSSTTKNGEKTKTKTNGEETHGLRSAINSHSNQHPLAISPLPITPSVPASTPLPASKTVKDVDSETLKNASQAICSITNDEQVIEDNLQAVRCFLDVYKVARGEPHGASTVTAWREAFARILDGEWGSLSLEDKFEVIGKYFETNFSQETDYRFFHFANEAIIQNRVYEAVL